ncbi:MAG TPA: redoxin domain-containing protein [Candidatus Dormibacteraeota bacterium]|nr:redoxin domain-containing protein [Candidatus Dormibacteraeota bacterium]
MSRRALGMAAAATLVALGLVSAFIGIHLNPASGGTLLVELSSRSGDSIGDTQIELHSPAGWSSLAHLSNTTVPAAPKTVTAAEVDVAPAEYDGIRLASADLKASITIRAGQVEPVLISVAGGVPQAAYAGGQDFNDGLLGLQGRLKSLPDFALVDQDGQTVSRQAVAGSVLVLAAFHTTCHDTCPLYTSILHQLRGEVPSSVHLLEVSTDPAVDDVAALKAYAQLADTSWPLLTGSQAQLEAFWSTFGVQLSGADSHTNFLGVFDANGFLHQVETGIPDAGSVPGGLAAVLSPVGLSELHSHGDGWDAAQVADQVRTAAALGDPSAGGGGRAPAFSVAGLNGGRVALADFGGGPLIVNFWASSCAPCRQEMPLIASEAASHHVKVLLVDERDSASAARAFLRQVGVNEPVAADPDGAVGRLYGVSVLPVTVFIRADGSIEGKYLGETDAAVLGAHLTAIGA